MAKRTLSSSFVTDAYTYHVFLSFRGIDTRFDFTNNLHQALVRKGIRSFIDHEKLQVGEEISPTLAKAIGGSRIGIIVFSENYASSIFCLEELVQILKCIKGKGGLVWPIFYKIEPCNVRHQIKSYKEAFDKLEKIFGNNSYEIIKWKTALYEAANLKGEHFTGDEYEHDFIGRIVQRVSRIINRQPLHISANYLVGLDSRVQRVTSLLFGASDEDECMVGICGIGGIGKSTIARAVFNLIADQFDNLCFLTDIKENSIDNKGLVQLQQTLLLEILDGENIKFNDVQKGSEIIKDRLQLKKILMVLDNVDKLKQLRALAGRPDWFGLGSRIIITTRDKHLLRVHGVERIYEVEGLNDVEAYELFSWNAFKKNKVDTCHTNMSMRAVRYCNGLPLALDIIGCNLFGKKIEECESALDAYERSPIKEIQEILKISYDGLEKKEQVVFLDMACFFKGYKLRDIKDILLNGRGSDLQHVIPVLVEKSLINIDPIRDIVNMHDLIQDMGREIVRQESNLSPGEWSRLWYYEDILDVLQENKGTEKTEFIRLDLPEYEEVEWDGEAFKDMKNLRVLIIRNARFSKAPKHLPNSLRILDWSDYPSSSFPPDFCPRKLIMLNLPNWEFALDIPLQKFNLLTHINLSNNRFLRQVPDLSGVPNLRRLNLQECINLIQVHDSIGHHGRITEMCVSGCFNLRIFPHSVKSIYLSLLDLSRCLTLPSFPNSVANNLTVTVFDAFDTLTLVFDWIFCGRSMFSKLGRLLSRSGEGSAKVTSLLLQNCHRIDEVLITFFPWFLTMEVLKLNGNKLRDEFLYTRLPWFPNLTELDLTGNDFTTLPACINQCCFLRTLFLDHCYKLRDIRGIPSSVKHLSAIRCTSLTLRSLSLLLSQKLHDGGGTCFILPGSRIPNWFDHRCRGSSLSFGFRKKFPLFALCLVYRDVSSNHYHRGFIIQLHVNAHKIGSLRFPGTIEKLGKHVHLFDFQNIYLSLELDEVEGYTKDEWNHVEVKLEGCVPKIEWMGVYLFKQNLDTVDVRFTNPTVGGENIPPWEHVNMLEF